MVVISPTQVDKNSGINFIRMLFEQGCRQEGWKKLFEQLRQNPWSKAHHLLAAELYEARGDHALALKHFRIYHALRKYHNLPRKNQNSYLDPLSLSFDLKWDFTRNESLYQPGSHVRFDGNSWRFFRRVLAGFLVWVFFMIADSSKLDAAENRAEIEQIDPNVFKSENKLENYFLKKIKPRIETETEGKLAKEEILFYSLQADTLKVRTYDDKGPVETNIELIDLATQDTTRQATTQGTATFPFRPVGIPQDAFSKDFTLAPNPAKDHARLQLPVQGIRKEDVIAYNTLGQVLDIARPGDDDLHVTGRGPIILTYGNERLKAIINDDATISIEENYQRAGTLKSLLASTHAVHVKPEHLGDPKKQNHEEAYREVDKNSIDGGSLELDIELMYNEKNNWLAAQVAGASNAQFEKPEERQVGMTESELALEQFTQRYDLREGLAYEVTFSGEHADDLTIQGVFNAGDTISIQDTLIHRYGLSGETNATLINIFSKKDTTRQLASLQDPESEYELTFKEKSLQEEVIIKASDDSEEKRYEMTLTPGPNNQDLLLGKTLSVYTYDDKGPVDGLVELIDVKTFEKKTKHSNEGRTTFSIKERPDVNGATHIVTWYDPHDGDPKRQNHYAEGRNFDEDTLQHELRIPLRYSPKDNWLTAQVAGASNASVQSPDEREVALEDGKMPLQRFTDTYDLREGLPYEVTFSGGPYADDLVVQESFVAGDTISIQDTLIMNYALSGETNASLIRVLSKEDTTRQLASLQGPGGDYELTFKQKSLEEAVIVKADKDGQRKEYELTLKPGPNGQDIIFTTQGKTVYVRGPTSRNATITTSTGQTFNADNEGGLFESFTTGADQVVLSYTAPNTDSEEQVIQVADNDTVDLRILNTHYDVYVDADSEISFTYNGAGKNDSGLGGDTLRLSARTNTLEARLQGTATDLTPIDTTFFASAGTNTVDPLEEWWYRVTMTNTENSSSITGSVGAEEKYVTSGTGGSVEEAFSHDEKTTTLNVRQEKDGKNPTDNDYNVSKGDNEVALPSMTDITNPLETFYTSPGVTTRNATIAIKDGEQTVRTIYADGEGNVPGTTIDWQLEDGKDLTLTYTAPSADNENITKIDVDDEETISLDHLLNAYFPITISADGEVSWNANGATGTGNGVANLTARANDLQVNFAASAPSAENYSDTKTYPVGGGSQSIIMDWIYNVTMQNTEEGSSITGSVDGNNVFNATGNGGNVTKNFTRTGEKQADLRVEQDKNNYTSSDQTFNINKGASNITLQELLGQYTLIINNTVTGTLAEWLLNSSFADSKTGSGTITLYKELDEDQASSDLTLSANGYEEWNDNRTIYPGTTTISADQQGINNPETFYTSPGVTTRNATIIIKDGTTPIDTLYADANGNVAGASITHELEDGKDLVFAYNAPNADNENITKIDVDQGETVSIDHLLNAYFPITINADGEVNWQANEATGTGNGVANLTARANDLQVNFAASAPSAENYSTSRMFSIGGGSQSIIMDWIYNVTMQNTEEGSTITGSVGGNNVFNATGNGGNVTRSFTRTGEKQANLRIEQDKNNYTDSDQTFSVNKGSSNVALDELLGQYTLIINNTASGTLAEWLLNSSFADSETGSGTITLYKELDADQANSDLTLTADGYEEWNDNRTIYPGTTSITASQQAINTPETFYTAPGTTTRNATIIIKDGTTPIDTLYADNEGNVAGASITHELGNGKDLIFAYTAPNADNENITKIDVDDGETVSVDHLLNAYFPVTITADGEVNWNANGATGTGNGTANLTARANDLQVNFSASAPSAENYSDTKTYPVGGGSQNIIMDWIYNVTMQNTENGSSITGFFNDEQVYTASGNGGNVTKNFTRTGEKSGTLKADQTLSGYLPTSNSKTVSKGSNSITLDDMLPESVNIRFVGTSSSPPGSIITFTEEGTSVSGTVDSNGDYTTNHLTVPNVPVTIDNVTIDGPTGWIDENHNNSVIANNQGDNNYEFNLEEEAQGETFTLDIGHADQRADNWINTGTWHIRTLSDDKEHTFPITSGAQTFEITGNYDQNTQIKTWVTGVNGFEDLVQTYVASYQQPIASNGNRNDTLTTTIGALDGGLKYNLIMKTSVYDDDLYRGLVNGGKEWNGQLNGHRGMTRFISLQRRVLDGTGDNAGNWADNLSTDEVNALYERSALFDQGFFNRGTGYVVLETNQEAQETYEGQSPYNKTFINYDTRAPPQNGPPYPGPTYDYRSASVPTYSHAITLSVEFVEAVTYPTEVNGTSSYMVNHTGATPYLTEIGKDVSMTNLTYKGGQAPDD